MKKAKLLFKALASLWVVYNIFTMMVMPNVSAYFGRTASSLVTPYANTIGLNASWNFFSPDPAHTMYIHYIVRYQDSEGNETKESVDAYFPMEKNKGITQTSRKRDLYAMRFMVIEPKRLRILMGPWLCRQYPGATLVEMEHVIETVPPLDQVLTHKDDSVKDLSQEIQYVKEDHSCTGGADEEVL